MNIFADERRRNVQGYPRTIYDDGDTRIEVWKYNNVSILVLLIPNHLLTQNEPGATRWKINDIDFINLELPAGTNPLLREALDCQRFASEDSDDVLATDEYLRIHLGITLTNDFGELLDRWKVNYDRPSYLAFKKEWSAEIDKYLNPDNPP